MTYKIINEYKTIIKVSTNTYIPMDEANTDYQAYLAWVAEGNTAEEWTNENPV